MCNEATLQVYRRWAVLILGRVSELGWEHPFSDLWTHIGNRLPTGKVHTDLTIEFQNGFIFWRYSRQGFLSHGCKHLSEPGMRVSVVKIKSTTRTSFANIYFQAQTTVEHLLMHLGQPMNASSSVHTSRCGITILVDHLIFIFRPLAVNIR